MGREGVKGRSPFILGNGRGKEKSFLQIGRGGSGKMFFSKGVTRTKNGTVRKLGTLQQKWGEFCETRTEERGRMELWGQDQKKWGSKNWLGGSENGGVKCDRDRKNRTGASLAELESGGTKKKKREGTDETNKRGPSPLQIKHNSRQENIRVRKGRGTQIACNKKTGGRVLSLTGVEFNALATVLP